MNAEWFSQQARQRISCVPAGAREMLQGGSYMDEGSTESTGSSSAASGSEAAAFRMLPDVGCPARFASDCTQRAPLSKTVPI